MQALDALTGGVVLRSVSLVLFLVAAAAVLGAAHLPPVGAISRIYADAVIGASLLCVLLTLTVCVHFDPRAAAMLGPAGALLALAGRRRSTIVAAHLHALHRERHPQRPRDDPRRDRATTSGSPG